MTPEEVLQILDNPLIYDVYQNNSEPFTVNWRSKASIYTFRQNAFCWMVSLYRFPNLKVWFDGAAVEEHTMRLTADGCTVAEITLAPKVDRKDFDHG